MPAKKRLPRKAPKLTKEQIQLVATFANYALDYPILPFDQVARRVMHSRPFLKTRTGREFQRQAKEVYDTVNLAYRASLKRRTQESGIRSAITKRGR